jgi:hypothetical protein
MMPNPKETFRVQTFLPIMDQLIVQMRLRREAYEKLYERFNFLVDRSLPSEEVRLRANALVEHYPDDLQHSFFDEFIVFSAMFAESAEKTTVADMIRSLITEKLISSFPNVYVALRLYLAILGTNCEGERSFSKLSLIKNHLRSTMEQQRLSSLALLSIENVILRATSFESVIHEFADKKSRKVHIERP